MRIGELGSATGVDVETIRYYEKVGLLPLPARRDNGYRSYGDAHLERLAFIRHCRALDMPLAGIKRLLDFLGQPYAECGDVDRLIDEQLARVRTRIKSLRALEHQLAALRSCCAAPHTAADCGILHELVTAAQQEAPSACGNLSRLSGAVAVRAPAKKSPPRLTGKAD
jgi:Cd(II)/Pb(II)-responsive transcriptional regulator